MLRPGPSGTGIGFWFAAGLTVGKECQSPSNMQRGGPERTPNADPFQKPTWLHVCGFNAYPHPTAAQNF